MMGFDSPDHHSQVLLVDCGYTRVIASRVGALGSSFVRAAKPGDFTRAKREKPPRDESFVPRFPQGKLREFTLKELGKATNSFSSKRVIGHGGFGKVFKGILSDGTVVAVKVRDRDSGQGLEQFHVELDASCTVMTLAAHPNLVPAIGFHNSRKGEIVKVMIVYPFMANGDVSLYLGDRQPSPTPIDWPTRKRIALGVARGICSLHELGIVHRDIKPSNIMLDKNFDAHIGDFGLANSNVIPRHSYQMTRLYWDLDSRYYDTRLCGTIGYISPEMLVNGHCSRKSDVYAFGVTLIQLVTGKPLIDVTEEGKCVPIQNREELLKNDEDLTRHMHPCMLGMYDESEVIELIRLGLICSQYDPEKRPLMPEVIAMMEGSSANLKQRWDNYDNTWGNGQLLSYNQSQKEWFSGSFFSDETSGSELGDDEEVCYSYEVDANEEELEENEDSGNQLQAAEDFASEESNKEHRAGNVRYQHHGYQSGVSCDDSVQPDDASSGVSGVESTSLANMISPENDTLAEIVEVDQKGGNSKQLSSQANWHEGASDDAATKLREMLDQMREMELKHKAAMEEMHQKQIVIMQEMTKMQGEYIHKVNEMQPQIDQLKRGSTKALAYESNHLSLSFHAVQMKFKPCSA